MHQVSSLSLQKKGIHFFSLSYGVCDALRLSKDILVGPQAIQNLEFNRASKQTSSGESPRSQRSGCRLKGKKQKRSQNVNFKKGGCEKVEGGTQPRIASLLCLLYRLEELPRNAIYGCISLFAFIISLY